MRVFHAPSHRASGNERGARALERLCERVGAFRTRSLVGEDFEDVERELHAQFVETEREVLGELLESLDVDVPDVEIDERRYHRVLDSTESYTTAVGSVKVRRTLYRCARERAGGADGASGGDCGGSLDTAGGASRESHGGTDDAGARRGDAA